MLADSWPEARELQLFLLRQMESGYSESDFVERPSALERVEEIMHADGHCKARIYRDRNNRYEVQYFIFAPERGGGWIDARSERCTFANTIEAAREVADLELEQLAKHEIRIITTESTID
jgi:hypothetical protein